jgi:hypothetical protein
MANTMKTMLQTTAALLFGWLAAGAQQASTPVEDIAKLNAQASRLEVFEARETTNADAAEKLRAEAEKLAIEAATNSGSLAVTTDVRHRLDYLFRIATPDAGDDAMLKEVMADQSAVRQNITLISKRLAELDAERKVRGRECESVAEALRARVLYHRRNAQVASDAAAILRSRAERYELRLARENALSSVALAITGSPEVTEAVKALPDLSGLPSGEASDKKLDRAVDRLLNKRRK